MSAKPFNPYEDCVWCEGAADTLTRRQRAQYAHKIEDLREKKRVLKSRRPSRKGVNDGEAE